MSRSEKDARLRAEVILKVRSGVMTAAEAARQLKVSRKTYYKWEKRALEAMLDALTDRPSGRPTRAEDGEKASMKEEMEAMRKELLLSEQRMSIQGMLLEDLDLLEEMGKRGVKKKPGR
jgi:transposase